MNDEDIRPEDARIRALLADLSDADDTALPPEVAARLDETLSGLVAEQQADRLSEERPATGAVVPLRPRWMPRVAAAAAAIIVLGGAGVAAKTLGPLGGGAGSSSSSSAGSGAGGATSAQSDAESAPTPSAGTTAGGQALSGAKAVKQLTALRPDSFAADVGRLLGSTAALRVPAASGYGASDKAAASCVTPSVTDGSRTFQVTYAGRPAVLVVHPSQGGRRLVEAFGCSGGHRLASTTVAP